MGGKLFSTGRLTLNPFLELRGEVLSILNKEGIQCAIPLWYRTKPDFGDLDIVIHYDSTKVNFPAIVKKYGWDKGVKNSNCYSFPYKNFQVDLIYTQEKYFESTLDFMSYNDLGNLIGKLAHSIGLKYGSKGLFFRTYEGAGKAKYDIELTKDMRDVCFLLGLNYNNYEKGFDTLEDIYEFIYHSYFFDPESFAWANQNNATRVRDRKRSTISNFVEWIEKQPEKTIRLDHCSLTNLAEIFPNFALEYIKIREKVVYAEKLSKKFNGHIVMELIGNELQGAELGTFLEHLRNVFAHYNPHILGWKKFVYHTPKYKINEIIKEEYANYNN